jgi:hypothetical protein
LSDRQLSKARCKKGLLEGLLPLTRRVFKAVQGSRHQEDLVSFGAEADVVFGWVLVGEKSQAVWDLDEGLLLEVTVQEGRSNTQLLDVPVQQGGQGEENTPGTGFGRRSEGFVVIHAFGLFRDSGDQAAHRIRQS